MELLLFIKICFLGLLQGLTEPLPISSSGHLVLVQNVLNIESNNLSFEVLMNTASLLAILFIYKRDLIQYCKSFTMYLVTRNIEYKGDFLFVIYLLLATFPAAIIGLMFSDEITKHLTSPSTVGVTLIITGIALWIIRNLDGRKIDKDVSAKDSCIVGLAQSIALIPGISRSGATIVGAMLLGMKQSTALRFSFFLYIPVSVGGIIMEYNNLLIAKEDSTLLLSYCAAFVIAFISSYFALKWLINVMKNGNLIYFSFYCFIVGILALSLI